MGQACSMCAILECSQAVAKVGPLVVTPENGLMGAAGPVASIMAFKPFVNINFIVCKSPLNPAVIPPPIGPGIGPCIPVPVGPWLIGAPTVMTRTGPMLNDTSKLICAYGGQISVKVPGAPTVMTP